MDRTEFERLLNREIDGLLSPEDAARLNDWTSRNDEAGAEQQALHRIHRAFQAMERPVAPPDLGRRIADRITAAAAHGPSLGIRLAFPRVLTQVAAALVVLLLALGSGFWLGRDQQVRAGADAWRQGLERQHSQWIEWGLTPEQATRVVTIKEQYRANPAPDAGDRETGAVFSLMTPPQLARYCGELGIDPSVARHLMERSDGT
jgi:hypothetical protein